MQLQMTLYKVKTSYKQNNYGSFFEFVFIYGKFVKSFRFRLWNISSVKFSFSLHNKLCHVYFVSY